MITIMGELIQILPAMNPFLFGSLVLAAFWALTLAAVKTGKLKNDIREFWWASFTCSWFGVTEPLFVPEYWTPPSIFKVWRWDLESFLFCFAIGGITAVVTELPAVARLLRKTATVQPVPDPDRLRIENMVLVVVFIAMFGATGQFDLNIIYDAAIVCVVTAGFVAWRRPGLRWQILGGGVTFLAIYTVVLVVTGLAYPDFYDHWNVADLTNIWLLDAPLEEYLFAFTFGLVWAPLYETWKAEAPPRARSGPTGAS